ncbi:MAG: helix-turn-helix domain-containing protein [Flavisolibacter sp.]
MATSDLQVKIFQHIKSKLPSHLSLVDEMAQVLDVSTDSAYRRIRGEKPISLEEIYKLCVRFQLSLDQLMNLQSSALIFTGNFIHPSSFEFDQYLQSAIQHVKYMSGFKEKQMYYLCKDIPIFHHFHFREVAAFKYYVWMKGIFNVPQLHNKKFSLKDYPDELFELGQKSLSIYNEIDSVEIWSFETFNSSIRQIDYYLDSGMFEDEEEAILIYEAYDKLVTHLDKQATLGYKLNADQQSTNGLGKYQFYLNEMVIGDNSVLGVLDGTKVAFIIHSVINIMVTRDTRFCDNLYDCVQNLMKRSTLISSYSERERERFFKYLRHRIERRKHTLKAKTEGLR